MEQIYAAVIGQEKLASDVYSMWLDAGDMARASRPGQFICLYSKDQAHLLPRPISICEVDEKRGALRIVYRVVGYGTEEFSRAKAGERIKITGPLGNGYTLKKEDAILVAGGIGIPPMLELAKRLDAKKTIVLGYRDERFLDEEFAPYGKVVLATEDGSAGTKGNVLDAIKARGVSGSVIYACGPIPMLRALKAYAMENGMEAQISLEEKMACGIGACLACVCESTETDGHSLVRNKRICKDGPVFDAREVAL